ncbi:hypothetical protein ACOMHN_062134 [Nucella lapillus]
MANRRRNRRAERRAEKENRGAADALVEDSSDDEDQQVQPTLHTLRPHKLPKFSGDEDADSFIREATLMLQLQPMTDVVAVAWLFSSLEGQAKQEILSYKLEDFNSPEKFLSLLERRWGDQRDNATLSRIFFLRQQGPTESVCAYATELRLLWRKTNATQRDNLSAAMLRSAYANGLHPASLRRDLKHFLRQKPESTFSDTVQEAQRWMREDRDPDATVEQTAVANPGVVKRLETEVAILRAEMASLKEQMRQCLAAGHHTHPPGPPLHIQSCEAVQRDPDPDSADCHWCARLGHTEDQCRSKRAYLKLSRQRQRRQQKQ